jgi:ABC-type transport system involved in cytochrome c biogenesis permease component
MLRAIFWKEWRQQSPFLFAILILMPIIGVICWAAGMSGNERSFSIANLALVLAVCAAVIQAIVTGSLLFASEVEEGTLPFLDACSAERGRIWRAKMLSGLAIAMPALVLPTLLGGFAGLQASILAAETVLMTAAVSVFVRTTFRAIGVAALLLCVITIVLVKLETVSG